MDRFDIDNNQFGFQKGKITFDAILQFLYHAYDSRNNGQYLLAKFLDISKVFDTISFKIF